MRVRALNGTGMACQLRCAIVVIALTLTGCATTPRLNNFEILSKAGTAYADAMVAKIDYAQQLGIRADSAVLIEARSQILAAAFATAAKDGRQQLSEQATEDVSAGLLAALEASNGKLKEQIAVMAETRRHVALMADYFEALALLAGAGDADSAIGEAASNLVAQMASISTSLGSVRVGDQTLAEFTGTGVPLVVSGLRARKLEEQLRKNGQAIDRELKALEGLATFLAEKIKSDDRAVSGPREAEAVWTPYGDTGSLPADWADRRAFFLTRSADVARFAQLQDAASNLRLALRAAAEGLLSVDQLSSVVTDMKRLEDLADEGRARRVLAP
jgi:hypothetical protein